MQSQHFYCLCMEVIISPFWPLLIPSSSSSSGAPLSHVCGIFIFLFINFALLATFVGDFTFTFLCPTWWLITLRVTQPTRPRSHTYGEAFNHSEEVLESYFFFLHLLHLNMVLPFGAFFIWRIFSIDAFFISMFLW